MKLTEWNHEIMGGSHYKLIACYNGPLRAFWSVPRQQTCFEIYFAFAIADSFQILFKVIANTREFEMDSSSAVAFVLVLCVVIYTVCKWNVFSAWWNKACMIAIFVPLHWG